MRAAGASPLEKHEQVALAAWLDFHGVVWTHVPNGGSRDRREASNLKRQGVRAGIPDVLVFSHAPLRPDARGVAIELKRERGGRTSAEQRAWLDRMTGLGWVTYIAHGSRDAIRFLESVGFGRPR